MCAAGRPGLPPFGKRSAAAAISDARFQVSSATQASASMRWKRCIYRARRTSRASTTGDRQARGDAVGGIFKGRYTAQLQKPAVLFLIGMRVNQVWNLRKWWLVVTAMPRMLAELRRKPESGFLGARTFVSGRVVATIQYWRSFDDLLV